MFQGFLRKGPVIDSRCGGGWIRSVGRGRLAGRPKYRMSARFYFKLTVGTSPGARA